MVKPLKSYSRSCILARYAINYSEKLNNMKDFNENCPLCKQNTHKVLWSTKNCKAIKVIDENFGLHRIIWNKHVKEISELTAKEALELMQNVLKLEKYVKVNIHASRNLLKSLKSCRH